MKRKTGAAKERETIAEQRMREAAKAAGENRFSFGSEKRKGSPNRGKNRTKG
ncbi:MAG TPA: hypothetical protein VKP89_19795 [Burkholderiales bacterium]|jgi:hypothetical protein|nr:hypothetical protein [Burkholderiales bacterium]HXZ93934.1 hypothetical protein [Burkholderiales bacterium]